MKGLLGFHTIGRLRVRLKNSITGNLSAPLWERSGHQGDQWIRADVAINTSWPVTQVRSFFCSISSINFTPAELDFGPQSERLQLRVLHYFIRG